MCRSRYLAALALVAALALAADARKLLQDEAALEEAPAAGAEDAAAPADCLPLTQFMEENPDKNKKLKKFAALLTALDVDVGALDESGEGLTIFAPNNKALKEALEVAGVTEEQLTESDEAKAVVLEIISYHVVKGRQGAAELTAATEPVELETMLEGEMLTASIADQSVTIAGAENEATVTKPDAIDVCEGIIHQIDTLLIPPGGLEALMELTEGGEGDAEGDAAADAEGAEEPAAVDAMEDPGATEDPAAAEDPAATEDPTADAEADPAADPTVEPVAETAADQPPTRR